MPDRKGELMQVVWYNLAILERFSSVLFPLDVVDLLNQIPTLGYIVPESVQRRVVEPGRPLATKGDMDLLINQDNKTIGLRGRNADQIVEALKELREFYLERLDPSPGMAIHYIELDGEGYVRSKRNPTEVCSGFWAEYSPLNELGRLLGHQVTNFGLQLVPPNSDPNDPNWFHLYVEPLVVSADSRYHIRWIWRGVDRDQLLERFSKIDEIVGKLVLRLEGG